MILYIVITFALLIVEDLALLFFSFNSTLCNEETKPPWMQYNRRIVATPCFERYLDIAVHASCYQGSFKY